MKLIEKVITVTIPKTSVWLQNSTDSELLDVSEKVEAWLDEAIEAVQQRVAREYRSVDMEIIAG